MKKQQFLGLVYGWIVIFGLMLLISFVLGLLLRFTGMEQATLSWVTLTGGLISLFAGGIVAGVKGKQKGWIIGSMTGIGFTLIIFLIQYFGYQQPFTLEQSLHHIAFIVAAVIGGIIGVNRATDVQK